MSRALAACALGLAVVDLEEDEVVEITDDGPLPQSGVAAELPLLVAADSHGPRIVAVVDRRPPLVVSDDAGATWREAGGGLPPGVAVAISPDHPDDVLYATRERLFRSRDGGRFWAALSVELPEISAVAFAGDP
jgi:hypothetical protein